MVNLLLRESSALPQLVKGDEWDYHLYAMSPDHPLADRMAAEAAMAFIDVICAGERDRLRVCAAHDCVDVFVDLSKNRSRRFCERAAGTGPMPLPTGPAGGPPSISEVGPRTESEYRCRRPRSEAAEGGCPWFRTW
jgi:hypothetical protein